MPSVSQLPPFSEPCISVTLSGSETLPFTFTQVWGTPTVPNVCVSPFQTSMSGPPVGVHAGVVSDVSPDVARLLLASADFTRIVYVDAHASPVTATLWRVS